MKKHLAKLFAAFVCLLAASTGLVAQANHVVISAVYGGGGNTGAALKNDYIELFNPTSASVDLSAYKILYGSASGTWTPYTITFPGASTIAPNSYFLIQAAAGTCTGAGSCTTTAPAPDATSTAALSGAAGIVALIPSTASAPSNTVCPTGYLDLVGYGNAASGSNHAVCYEGAAAAPTLSNTTAANRIDPYNDSNNNGADFTSGSPNPHNSGNPPPPVTPTVLAIHTLLGSRPYNPSTIQVSPYAGQLVTVTGVVIGIGNSGYFIEAQDSAQDGDPSTPEGVYVFTNSAPGSSTIAIGNLVSVTGSVATYPAATASHTPATELTGSTATLVTAGVALPTPIALTASTLTPSGGIYQMARYEGMRVTFPNLVSISGTDGSITEATATTTSNGQFFATYPDYPRPVREPGIDIRDAVVPNTPANVARFDDNPERILIDTKFLGGTPVDIPANTVVMGLSGIVDMTYSSDSYYDPARILVDSTYTFSGYTQASTTQYAVGGGTGKFSVASYNVERMFNTDSTDNKYYDPVSQTVKTSSAVNLTPAAFDARITKIARGILVNLNAPDIVGLAEIENQGVAAAISAKISSLASSLSLPDPAYAAYGVSAANGTYTSDVGGISTGFLVKPSTVSVTSTQQMGQNETFNSPTDQSVTTLNDRPAFVLKGGIIRGAGVANYPITVIINHLRSLSGISDASNYTRYKKELQAESLAKIIQAAQTNGEHVISVGDYNAFQFSDGYTDTMGTVTGRILPADQVVQPGVLITNPAATDLSTINTNEYSYSYLGNTQSLDHVVVTSNLMPQLSSFMGVNINADYPISLHGDSTTAFSTSDHDPVIAYFNTPSPVASATITPTSLTFGATLVGATSSGQQVVLTNTGERAINLANVTVTGPFAYSTTCDTVGAPVGGTCNVNVTFKPTTGGANTGTMTLYTNGGPTFSVQLAGTGVADFSVAGNTGTNVSLTVTAGSTATLPLTFSSVGGFTGTIAVSCALVKPAPGVVCNMPANFTLAGTTTQNVTFTTTTRNVGSGVAMSGRSGLSLALSLGLAGVMMLFAGRTRRFARHAGLLLVLLGVSFAATGCGNSSASTNPYGTPVGAYNYTVTSTSGTLSHSVTVTLNVQ